MWRHVRRVRRITIAALGWLIVWYERVTNGTCLSAVQKTMETIYFGGTADGHQHVTDGFEVTQENPQVNSAGVGK